MGVVLMTGCGKEAGEEPEVTDMGPKKVKLETSMSDIVIELNEEAAPVTVRNFLRYVEEGFYDGTIFHRVKPSNPAMIQGGGFTVDIVEKETRRPIANEASNGLRNDRGTIAMARTKIPNSATSQFFINHKNNDFLNYVENRKAGYAVFGKVVEGMDVVDTVAKAKTGVKTGTVRMRDGSMRKVRMSDVPLELVVIRSAKVVSGR
jgi:cyclophilin family peptidyl-prolyl cis-trans isomerase